MKNKIITAILFFDLIASIGLNLFVMERCGSFVNYVLIFGLNGQFTLDAELTFFSFLCGVVGLVFAAFSNKILAVKTKTQNFLAVVPIYLNIISLFALLVMTFFPTVHLRGG